MKLLIIFMLYFTINLSADSSLNTRIDEMTGEKEIELIGSGKNFDFYYKCKDNQVEVYLKLNKYFDKFQNARLTYIDIDDSKFIPRDKNVIISHNKIYIVNTKAFNQELLDLHLALIQEHRLKIRLIFPDDTTIIEEFNFNGLLNKENSKMFISNSVIF